MAKEDQLANARMLASRLQALAAEISSAVNTRQQETWMVDGNDTPSLDALSESHGRHSLSALVDVVGTLNSALEVAGFGAEIPFAGSWDFYSLGSVTFYGKPRSIHVGFVQPVLRLPIVTRMPDRVIAFLTRIPGSDEWLKGENHSNLGYHYHYLNAKKERSDVALCWDTRAPPQEPHPLFQEKHGESHSSFSGRPDLWGTNKRDSMHQACAKDLTRWPLDKFRMACDKAGPVWPLSAVLTARPTHKAVEPRFPSKRKRVR